MGRRRAGRVMAAAAAVAALALAVALPGRLWPPAPLLRGVPYSTAVTAADGTLLRLTLADDGHYRLPARLEAVSPQLIDALLLHEDRHFWRHPGVNPVALARGALRTYVERDRRIGGSTLTMQLARRLYDIDSRRIGGKLAQIAAALWIEWRYDKREILEAYLTVAPWGGNVEGIAAASLVHFHRHAHDLTLAESLALAVVPQSPALRTPRTHNVELERARARLFERWRAERGASLREVAMLELPLAVAGSRSLPFLAPHATSSLLSRHDGTSALRTTLQPKLQRLLERRVEGFISRQRRAGVRNGAALLVDVRDMAVVASVGSAAFFDATISGQNDGTRARRSPGSLLKPFIYALAFEQGLLHPQTVLKDAPGGFGAFAPENFDGEFVGPVTAQDALVRSRNLPAVTVGLALQQPDFHGFLRTAGIGALAGARHYGLSLYLGGPELTPREVAMLYAALANGGRLRPLRDRVDEPQAAGARLLSEQASWVTLAMLAQNPRPAQVWSHDALRTPGPVYWKTGTSTGFRDAWSAGVFDHYVLVVWVGHFDGRPNPAFVGAQLAAPLFFEIVDALRATRRAALDRPATMLRPPAPLREVEVCAGSGDLPNAACPRTVTTWYWPGVSPIRVSTLHRALRVDVRTGLLACDGVPERYVRREVHEFWSSDLATIFAQAGLPRRAPPAEDPRCADAGSTVAVRGQAAAPAISSPAAGVSYVAARDGRPSAVPLRAVSDGSTSELYWFVDDAFIGRAARGETLEWRPATTGEFTLRVVDDHGEAAVRRLRVVAAP